MRSTDVSSLDARSSFSHACESSDRIHSLTLISRRFAAARTRSASSTVTCTWRDFGRVMHGLLVVRSPERTAKGVYCLNRKREHVKNTRNAQECAILGCRQSNPIGELATIHFCMRSSHFCQNPSTYCLYYIFFYLPPAICRVGCARSCSLFGPL